MRKGLLSLLALFACSLLFAQNYRSKNPSEGGTTYWYLPTSWQIETSPGVWTDASVAPNESAGQIEIRPGHYISVVNPTTANQVLVRGTLDLSGGTLTLVEGDGIGVGLTLTDGTVSGGPGDLQIMDEIRWTSGTFNLPLDVANGAILNMDAGSNLMELNSSLTIYASGGIDWTSGTLLINNGFFQNFGNVQLDGDQTLLSGFGTVQFINSGIINKLSGNTTISMPFLTNGTINIAPGATLETTSTYPVTFRTGGTTFTGSGTFRSGNEIAVQGPVDFNEVTFQRTAGTLSTVFSTSDVTIDNPFQLNGSFNGPGMLDVNDNFTLSGILTGPGELEVTGPFFEWTRGELGRLYTVPSGQVMIVSGAESKTLSADLTIAPNGGLQWNGGDITLNGGTRRLINNGQFNFAAPSTTAVLQAGGGGQLFQNNGVITNTTSGSMQVAQQLAFANTSAGRLNGTGTYTFESLNYTNTGTIEVGTGSNIGTLTLNGGAFANPFSNASTLDITINNAGTAGVNYDQLRRTGSMTLDGALDVTALNEVPKFSTFRIIQLSGGVINGVFDEENVPFGYDVVYGIDFVELVVEQILPVRMIEFTGAIAGTSVNLAWKTSAEVNAANFEVLRSSTANGKFEKIGVVAAVGDATTESKYSFTDTKPLAGMNYYQLRINDRDGKSELSRKVPVKMSGLRDGLTLYPNPVRGSALEVQITGFAQSRMDLQVRDLSGRLIQQKTLNSTGNSLFTSVDVASLPAGVYSLTVRTGKEVVTKQFVKQ